MDHQEKKKIILDEYFANKRILITGATSGIGRACAFYFLNNGARVALVGRDEIVLDEIGSQFPGQAVAIKCDLAQDKQQYEMASTIIETLGGLDILINAAGVMFEGDIITTFPQDFDYMMDINVRCPFHLLYVVGDFLEKSKGCVVNVSAQFGHRAQVNMLGYCVTKAGVEMLTKVAALEFAPSGVRVNCVAAGYTESNIFKYARVGGYEYSTIKDRIQEHCPLAKMAKPEEIAKAIIFLASDQAKNITGHIMRVDGGHAITTSSYVKWEGTEFMNGRFEPSPQSFISRAFRYIKTKFHECTTTAESRAQASYFKSSWTTQIKDAHVKVIGDYSKLKKREDKLKSLYGQGQNINTAENPRAARRESQRTNAGFFNI